MRQPAEDDAAPLIDRHVRVGWVALLISTVFGLGLDALHAFKVGWYLDVANETRRLMWTLAHAHGTLLGLVNLAFAATARLRRPRSAARRSAASRCLLAATALLPTGFLLGGLFVYGGDPGLGIVLVPLGGALLVAALAQMVW
jgi:hypothetical protein